MSQKTLKNQKLTVIVDSLGAELQSIKTADGTEYLWQGDKEFWSRRSPILFPIVGKLKKGSYIYDDQKYNMSGHGFARDNEFKVKQGLLSELEHELEYELRENEETLNNYPFKFSLKVQYKLKENAIEVRYIVKNLDEKVMFFGIGAHPAFNAPIEEGSFEDYKISILPDKGRKTIPLNTAEGTLFLDRAVVKDESEFPLTRELFSEDALVFETPEKTDVIISNNKDDRTVKISYENMPFLGIWSPYPAEAPFVCIEPWCGIADDDQTDGNIATKFGINELLPDEKFECRYTIEIN
ncbi:aldose 1-epimerase family protein [Floricoccus penangensis]|uniref:aldose 1-epimerase family protein n=1 Tax=Floricoccus penangensis TaxID=1859475 RepID=UPI00203FC0CA|nr:aldose 1-epimerase family protein [Floricoccus penangensis]URZ87053.1 aldose 1-epimerase family protein [Floricoccus penangensis]